MSRAGTRVTLLQHTRLSEYSSYKPSPDSAVSSKQATVAQLSFDGLTDSKLEMTKDQLAVS